MDKKNSSTSSKNTCDRIKDAAVSICPNFKTILRVTHRETSTPYVRNNKIIEIHSRADPPKLAKPGLDSRHQKGDVVAIHFDFEKPKSSANPEVESHKKTGVHIEDSFSDYINRAKNIFRTSTLVVTDHGKGSKDQNDDEVSSKASSAGRDHKFNEFIERSKKKFRTTSNIGGGRSISFK